MNLTPIITAAVELVSRRADVPKGELLGAAWEATHNGVHGFDRGRGLTMRQWLTLCARSGARDEARRITRNFALSAHGPVSRPVQDSMDGLLLDLPDHRPGPDEEAAHEDESAVFERMADRAGLDDEERETGRRAWVDGEKGSGNRGRTFQTLRRARAKIRRTL